MDGNNAFPPPAILIVGAGAAGLAAASRLLSHNLTHLTILEAEPRIGGRVYSAQFGLHGAHVELGAEWCHGDVDNAVYDIVRGRDLLAVTDAYTDMCRSDGSWLDREHVEELLEVMDGLYTPDGDKGEEEGVSVGEYFVRVYTEAIQSKYKGNPDKIRQSLQTIQALHKIILTSEGSFSWDNTSATNDYRDCPGELLLNWKGKGYKQFLDILMAKHRNPTIESKLHLNKEVVHINWASKPKVSNTCVKAVTVYCKDGSVYQADHVIVTCSLGVLKNYGRKLFAPQLPFNKLQAIDALGFEGVMKVMMEFDSKWWPEGFTGAVFVWNDDDRNNLLREFPEGPIKDGHYSWLFDMMGVLTVENNPNVLSCWFLGNTVPQIEGISDDLIVKGIMFLLHKFVGKKFNISNPLGVKRMNWYTNPHFHGVYTFQTTKSRESQISSHVILGEPLYDNHGIPVVCFGGEATHPKYYSAVHGAVESGYREAERLVQFHKEDASLLPQMSHLKHKM